MGDSIVQKTIDLIARKFAASSFEELDITLDMLFIKDRSNQQRVTKDMFKEFILMDMKVPHVSERDLDLFMQTHELIA